MEKGTLKEVAERGEILIGKWTRE